MVWNSLNSSAPCIPQTPVLLVSGSLEAIDGRAYHLDRFAVLAKPFTSEELVHNVRTLLST